MLDSLTRSRTVTHKNCGPRFPVRTAFTDRRPLFTNLSSLVRTLFIPRRTDLWTQVSLIRTAFAALPTIHHIAFHIGRLAFASLPTRIVNPRLPVRTSFAHRRPLFTILFSLIRTLFIPRRTDLWTQVSLIRTTFAALPTIHHTAFHIGRHTF